MYEGEIKGQGSAVIIRQRPTIAISKYNVGGKINYQNIVDDKIKLTIDQANTFAFQIDDIDRAQSDINVMDELTLDASYQQKIAIEQQVLGTVYADASNVLTLGNITKANVLDWIIAAEVALQNKNVPVQDRWILIPPTIGGLIQLSDLKNTYMTGDATSIIRGEMTNDRIGQIGSMHVYITNNLPTVNGVVQCLAGHKSAITFAAQIDQLDTLTLQDTFAKAIRGLQVYGYKTLQPQALVSMPATAAAITF